MDIKLKDRSGREYEYKILKLEDNREVPDFKSRAGNYVFMKKIDGKWNIIYIGTTGDLSERFDNHHAMDCIKKNNATHIAVRVINNEQERKKEERDLIDNYTNSLCNKK